MGDAETVAERLSDIIKAAQPRHMLLQFQAGDSDQRLALRSIEAFASKVLPLVEKSVGPVDRIGPSAHDRQSPRP